MDHHVFGFCYLRQSTGLHCSSSLTSSDFRGHLTIRSSLCPLSPVTEENMSNLDKCLLLYDSIYDKKS
ncbi:hypothetical protein CRENBAI_014911 [Crenichthys baileyi]|uniref:Uncharacterized protein n=1 Tax=Crenichthys baileyi TaxID=28760 RepID=A0AAV9S4Z4_9TELE